ncbi:MAG: hypothetical protein AB8G96_03455 [Phycisphaerales bacterium]
MPRRSNVARLPRRTESATAIAAPRLAPRPSTPAALGAIASLAVAVAAVATAGPAGPTISLIDTPDVDRWFYPFNTTPGARSVVPMFGATNEADFDDRDGTMFLRWATDGEIPTGQGAASYEITAVTVRLTHANGDTIPYDPTVDPFTAFLPDGDPDQTADADPGQPFELFGIAGRNGFEPLGFAEDGPYSPVGPFGVGVRNLFAVDGVGGSPRDVSNSVRDGFTPTPWALGTIDGLSAGDLIPTDSVMRFDLDLSAEGVVATLQEQLDAGAVAFAVTSLALVQQQGGSFGEIYTKENVFVQLDLVEAPTIEIEWRLVTTPECPGNANGDLVVDFSDLLAVLSAFGPCGSPCPQDVDGSGDVGFGDVLTVLSSFGPCPG